MSIGYSDQQRAHVYEDLSGLVRGEVLSDPVHLQLYGGDGSVFEIRPLCVVRPRSAADVTACVRYCREHHLPIHPRGAGTGTAGGSLGPGIVLDFSAHMRRVLGVEQAGECVRVQPGVVLERLNLLLARHGRFVDSCSTLESVATIGGIIGRGDWETWAGNPASAGRRVREVTLVLDDGTRARLGLEEIARYQSGEESRKSRLVRDIAAAFHRHQSLLSGERSRAPFVGGYRVWNILQDGRLDLSQLVTGAEGTLGVIVEAVLDTHPIAPHAGGAILLFDSLDRAAGATRQVLCYRPWVCELLDRRHLSLTRQSDPRVERLIPDQAEAAIVLEMHGESDRVVRSDLQELVAEVVERKKLANGSRLVFDQAELADLRRLCDSHPPALLRGGATRPIPLLDDYAVPAEHLQVFLGIAQSELRRYGVTAALRCRLAAGRVQLLPFVDVSDRRVVGLMRDLAASLAQGAIELGGGFGRSQGLGIAYPATFRRLFPQAYRLFAEIKQAFDPESLFNPGKVVQSDPDYDWTRHVRPPIAVSGNGEAQGKSAQICSARMDQDWRSAGRSAMAAVGDGGKGGADNVGTPNGKLTETAKLLQPGNNAEGQPLQEELPSLLVTQLDWEPGRLIADVQQCNYCGLCRTQSSSERMCPIFRISPSEEASPRAKARMLHGVLSQVLPLETLTGQAAKTIADLCVHCHMCRLECPAEVDIPRLMSEAKAAYVAGHGVSTATWVMNRIDRWAAWASAIHPLANWALGNRPARWLLERICGVAHGRKLPRIYSPSFLRRAARRRLHQATRREGPKVVYFVDTFADWFDPELAEMAVAVLEHNGVSVYVPSDQSPAGTSAVASGELDLARRFARNNAMILAEAVRQGYHVVTTEPAAAVTLTREYPQLLGDDDSRLVAQNTSDLGDYLWKLHLSGRMQLDFRPITYALAYHLPCRLRALGRGAPGLKLIQLVPGLTIVRQHDACSGMAGTYGLMRENFRTSLRAGWGLVNLIRDASVDGGVTECSTCKIQMEQGTTKPTLHPIKLLAAAYGLFPGGTSRLFRPSRELTLT